MFDFRYANMDALVQPLLERFTAIGLAMPQATSIEQQEQCTSSMKHIIQMITAVSKGFIKPSHLMASQCNTIFEQALINFMQVRFASTSLLASNRPPPVDRRDGLYRVDMSPRLTGVHSRPSFGKISAMPQPH